LGAEFIEQPFSDAHDRDLIRGSYPIPIIADESCVLEEDVERLSRILRLTRELGVNLAGVEVILQMQEAMEAMEKDFNQLLASLRDEMTRRQEESRSRSSHALVRSQPARVIRLKKG